MQNVEESRGCLGHALPENFGASHVGSEAIMLSIGFTSHLLLAANSCAVRAGKYERPHYFGDTNSYSVLVDFKSLCIFRV